MNRVEALYEVQLELDHQNKKWKRKDGDWPSDPHTKLTILMEKVGEVARGLLDGDLENVREELADVAATAVAWLMSDFEPLL